ncbi:MAG: sigma 54-interacting transcriptional regulator [Leptospiraceae bacterium]|nr:sigma 54-interacting transcriptional regulator [Leptospiraceae bacterium]
MLLHLLYIILQIGFGAGLLIPGFLLSGQDRSNRIYRGFFFLSLFFCLSFGIDAWSRLLLHLRFSIGPWLFAISDICLNLGALTLLFVSISFPRRMRTNETIWRHPGFRGRMPVSWWIALWMNIALALLSFSSLYSTQGSFNQITGTYVSVKGPIFFANRILFLASLIVAWRAQWRFYRSQSSDPRRGHSAWLLWSIGLLGLVFMIWQVLANSTWYGNEAALLWGASVLIFTVLTYRIFNNLNINYKASLVYNTATAFFYLLVLTPFVYITYLLLDLSHRFPFWMLLFLGSLLYLAFQILSNGIVPWLQRQILRNQRIAQESISEYNLHIQELDPPGWQNIPAMLQLFVNRHFQARLFAFYSSAHLRKDQKTDPLFRLDQATVIQSRPGRSLAMQLQAEFTSFCNYLVKQGKSGGLLVELLYYSERLGLSAIARQLTELSSCGVEMLLLLFDHQAQEANQQLIGIILLGEHSTQRALDYTDFTLLSLLLTPTVLALKNRQLFEASLILQKRLEEENTRISQKLSDSLEVEGLSRKTMAVLHSDSPMQMIMDRARRFAVDGSSILITGETGTGKGQLARYIYDHSNRNGQFISINCSAIPADLIENELFGHVRGAYTGAVENRSGLIAQAQNGVLFIDEIGELSLESQIKLLRLIQDRTYEALGSNESLSTNALFIFATNRNLDLMIKDGHFRQDLFYRISTFELHIPPLRERRMDIESLLDFYLAQAALRFHCDQLTLDPDARQMLLQYHYPGNIRELENLILRASVLTDREVILARHLPVLFANRPDFRARQLRLGQLESERNNLERDLILEALQTKDGNQRGAAELLGISRGALQYKMKQYQIEFRPEKNH